MAATGATLGSRLGLPRMAGHGRFIAATGIDAIGTGLVLAFVVVYFVETTTLSLLTIGAAFTAGRLLAFPTAIVVGPIIDRVGTRATAIGGNLLSALGFGAFFWAHEAWHIAAVVFVVQVGHTTYWTSSNGLVVLAAEAGQERTRWFGLVQALRNAALSLGAGLGSLAFALGNASGLRLVVAANALSYLVAALLLSLWRPAPTASTPAATPTRRGGYGVVLRDGRYLLLITTNLAFVFAFMFVKVLLAIYLLDGLGLEAWLAGPLLLLNTVEISLLQTIITGRLERFGSTRLVAVGFGIIAASLGLFTLVAVTPKWMVVPGLFLAVFVYTLGEIVATPHLENLSLNLAPEHLRGRYLAVYQLGWTAGQSLAPGLFTFLLTVGHTVPVILLVALCLVAVPAVLYLEHLMRRPSSSPPSTAELAPVS